MLAALYHITIRELLVNSKAANKILVDQHPLLSFSILYACFTGFFLFMSGIIVGYVENGVNHKRVGERLQNHPLFKNTLPANKLKKLTKYVEQHLGSLIGNIIRVLSWNGWLYRSHFRYSLRYSPYYHLAGNTAIAYYTLGNSEGCAFMFTALGGVLFI